MNGRELTSISVNDTPQTVAPISQKVDGRLRFDCRYPETDSVPTQVLQQEVGKQSDAIEPFAEVLIVRKHIKQAVAIAVCMRPARDSEPVAQVR